MASWTRFDTDLHRDGDFHSLWKENVGFPWLFTALVGIAKQAADVDPDAWQGHLVSPTGRALSEEELIDLLPRFPRAHEKTCREFFATVKRLGLVCAVSLHECGATVTRPQHDSAQIAHEVDTKCAEFVLQISDWFRWWQRPEKPVKSSTERSRRRRARLAQEAMQRDACNAATPPTYSTDNTVQTIPPNPRCGGGDGMDFLEDSIDPDQALPDPRASEPASDDPEKFSSMLTRAQASELRARALREVVYNLSPGGLAHAQQLKLFGYLNTRPPRNWREGPARWADHLLHFVVCGVTEIREKLASKKNHGIGAPAAAAIGRAQALLAEFSAELGAA